MLKGINFEDGSPEAHGGCSGAVRSHMDVMSVADFFTVEVAHIGCQVIQTRVRCPQQNGYWNGLGAMYKCCLYSDGTEFIGIN